MTLVTTSRRSTNESRAVARDLAFALGARYLARGKRGIRELHETDSHFFILSQEERGLLLRSYHEGDLEYERRILKVECKQREGLITRGAITSDAEFYKKISRNCPVIYEEGSEEYIRVDGPQKRQTYIKLEKTTGG